MFPTAFICQSKAPIVFMQSNMSLGLHNSATNGHCYQFNPGRWALSTLRFGTEIQSLRRFVFLINADTALKLSVIYDHTMITKINNSPTAKGKAYGKGLLEKMVSRFAFLYHLRWNIDFKTFYTELPFWYDNEPSTECHFCAVYSRICKKKHFQCVSMFVNISTFVYLKFCYNTTLSSCHLKFRLIILLVYIFSNIWTICYFV